MEECIQCKIEYEFIKEDLGICNSCYWKNQHEEKNHMRVWEDGWGESWSKQNIGRY